jgi:hypothetical protein
VDHRHAKGGGGRASIPPPPPPPLPRARPAVADESEERMNLANTSTEEGVGTHDETKATHKERVPREKSYRCTFPGCNRAFTTGYYLLKHQKTHDEANTCKWPGCKRSFAAPHKLAQHEEKCKKGKGGGNAHTLEDSEEDF